MGATDWIVCARAKHIDTYRTQTTKERNKETTKKKSYVCSALMRPPSLLANQSRRASESEPDATLSSHRMDIAFRSVLIIFVRQCRNLTHRVYIQTVFLLEPIITTITMKKARDRESEQRESISITSFFLLLSCRCCGRRHCCCCR